MELNPEFVAILACPSCGMKVVQLEDVIACQNEQCSLRYPIVDGIPVMLIEESFASSGEEIGTETL